MSVSRSKIEEIHSKNANTKWKNAFDFVMKINLESDAYLEPSWISAIESVNILNICGNF